MQDLIRKRKRQQEKRQQRRAKTDTITDPDFVFFHIAKTGGGSIRQFLAPLRGRWAGAGHPFDLEQIAGRWPDAPVVFFVREPVSRFVSGFNNFQRAVLHKSKLPNDAQVVCYNLFPTANDLAEGLVSDDEFTLSAAHYAMSHLGFLSRHLTANLGSPANVDRHRDRIAYVGRFEDFDGSVEAMRSALDLPSYLTLPEDDARAHRAPSSLSTYLSDTGRAAVRDWYRDDIELYDHCVAIHHEQMATLHRG